MARYSQRRTWPTALIVIVVIIAVVALIAVVRAAIMSRGGAETSEISQADRYQNALLSTAVDHQVRMTVRGPIVGDEDFNSFRITVTPTSRSFVSYQGYLDQTITRRDFKNNTPAYEEFVNALDKANLTKGTPFEDEADDTRGICATGRVYEYEIVDDEGVIMRLWSSTCKGSKGSLVANIDQLTDLFVKQIPDSRALLREVNV